MTPSFQLPRKRDLRRTFGHLEKPVANSGVPVLLYTVVHMKALARSTVWWLSINKGIEKKDQACQNSKTRPEVAHLRVHPWELSRNLWYRRHIDFAGPSNGEAFFLVVDPHSKYLAGIHVLNDGVSKAMRTLWNIRCSVSRMEQH